MVNTGIRLLRDRYLNMLLFADDFLVLYNTKSGLQKICFKHHQISKQDSMKLSTTKTKERSQQEQKE